MSMTRTGFVVAWVFSICQPNSAGESRGRVVSFSVCATIDRVQSAPTIAYDLAGNIDKDLYRLVMTLMNAV
jgi:hypothetical protein